MSRLTRKKMQKELNSTKVICTIGPSSESRSVLKQLMLAGMRVARLNFSHGTHKHHKLIIDNIREVSNNLGVQCAILQDLQGPKIRVASLSQSVEVSKGEKISFILETEMERLLREEDDFGKVIPLQYDLTKEVEKGDTILIDDGLVSFKVLSVQGKSVNARVEDNGSIGSCKGVNMPGKEVNAKVITKKDIGDLQFGLKAGVDIIAMSFVKNADNIIELRKAVKKYAQKTKVPPFLIAKIERGIAVKNIDSILAQADGIMVARGDLGLEIPASEVPVVQKEIIAKCMSKCKPVIVATQMLDSMIRNPRPTRGEVSDVAGAVVDHADALMLSGETSYGKYPVQSCKTMSNIICNIEKSPYDNITSDTIKEWSSDEKALAHMTWTLSTEIYADAILVTTMSGRTARMVSRFRPERPILTTCDSCGVQRQLILSWGVKAFVLPTLRTFDALIKKAVSKCKKNGLLKKGDKIVIMSGQPVGAKGANLVKVHIVK